MEPARSAAGILSIHNKKLKFSVHNRTLHSPCIKQRIDFTNDCIFLIVAQLNGLPGTDAGADTATVTKRLIDLNILFFNVKGRHPEGAGPHAGQTT